MLLSLLIVRWNHYPKPLSQNGIPLPTPCLYVAFRSGVCFVQHCKMRSGGNHLWIHWSDPTLLALCVDKPLYMICYYVIKVSKCLLFVWKILSLRYGKWSQAPIRLVVDYFNPLTAIGDFRFIFSPVHGLLWWGVAFYGLKKVWKHVQFVKNRARNLPRNISCKMLLAWSYQGNKQLNKKYTYLFTFTKKFTSWTLWVRIQ